MMVAAAVAMVAVMTCEGQQKHQLPRWPKSFLSWLCPDGGKPRDVGQPQFPHPATDGARLEALLRPPQLRQTSCGFHLAVQKGRNPCRPGAQGGNSLPGAGVLLTSWASVPVLLSLVNERWARLPTWPQVSLGPRSPPRPSVQQRPGAPGTGLGKESREPWRSDFGSEAYRGPRCGVGSLRAKWPAERASSLAPFDGQLFFFI